MKRRGRPRMPPDAEALERLARAARGGDSSARDALIFAMEDFAAAIGAGYARRAAPERLDDARGAAILGLVEAVAAYDPAGGPLEAQVEAGVVRAVRAEINAAIRDRPAEVESWGSLADDRPAAEDLEARWAHLEARDAALAAALASLPPREAEFLRLRFGLADGVVDRRRLAEFAGVAPGELASLEAEILGGIRSRLAAGAPRESRRRKLRAGPGRPAVSPLEADRLRDLWAEHPDWSCRRIAALYAVRHGLSVHYNTALAYRPRVVRSAARATPGVGRSIDDDSRALIVRLWGELPHASNRTVAREFEARTGRPVASRTVRRYRPPSRGPEAGSSARNSA